MSKIRRKLKRYEGKTIRLNAVFQRTGLSPNHSTTHYLLRSLRRDRTLICGHVWVEETRELRNLQLEPGDTLEFDGVVAAYRRRGGDTDYSLRLISNIEVFST